MTSGLVVKERADQIDARTSHAIVAAQLRGETRAAGRDTSTKVRAIAQELSAIDLEPDVEELARRYNASETKVPSWMLERAHG